MSKLGIIELIGTILALIGATLLAFNIGVSKYAYLFFISAAPFLCMVCYKNKLWGFLGLQAAYFTINVIGLINWLL